MTNLFTNPTLKTIFEELDETIKTRSVSYTLRQVKIEQGLIRYYYELPTDTTNETAGEIASKVRELELKSTKVLDELYPRLELTQPEDYPESEGYKNEIGHLKSNPLNNDIYLAKTTRALWFISKQIRSIHEIIKKYDPHYNIRTIQEGKWELIYSFDLSANTDVSIKEKIKAEYDKYVEEAGVILREMRNSTAMLKSKNKYPKFAVLLQELHQKISEILPTHRLIDITINKGNLKYEYIDHDFIKDTQAQTVISVYEQKLQQ